MKIAMLYGPFCLGGDGRATFHVRDMWTSARGLTGSELSYVRMCQELVRRGHEVTAFSFFKDSPLPESFDGVRIAPFNDFGVAASRGWDAVCSWNEAWPLEAAPQSSVRLVNLQINSFTHCRPGFERFVDVFTSPSESHRQMILSKPHPVGTDHLIPGHTYVADPSRWKVLTNGCDPDHYGKSARVPGRVIYASSPDRGLHWLFQEWPKIKRAVPHAHLRVFYRLKPWIDNMLAQNGVCYHPSDEEQFSRAHYLRESIARFSMRPDLGVELVDSVSRERMNVEMSEAEVLAYPCDPVVWTEGFSVTLMEACAAGVLPVTCGVDALPEIYGGAVPMVDRPVKDNISGFTDFVIRGLTDSAFRSETVSKTTALAGRYRWSDLAKRLESIIVQFQDAKVRT